MQNVYIIKGPALRTAYSDQSTRPSINLSVRDFMSLPLAKPGSCLKHRMILGKGCAVTLSRDSTSMVKVIADGYEV